MTRKFLARENGIPVQVDESEISVEVPTKVSQLENDSGYATASEVDAKAAGYLPLSGGTMTGALTVNEWVYSTARFCGAGFETNRSDGHIEFRKYGNSAGFYLDTHPDGTTWYQVLTNYGNQHVTGSFTAAYDIKSTNGWMYAGCFKSTSDRRMKKDLKEIHPDLSGIRAYHYRFKNNDRPAYGLIAQEVQEILPDAVTESGEDRHLTLDYNAVVAALVDEVNRLKLRVAALEGSTK